jgi:hypothetical protein
MNSCASPKLNAAAQRKFVLFASTLVWENTLSVVKLNKLELRGAATDPTLRQH